MAISINIVAEFNGSFADSKISIDRDNIQHFTVKSFAGNLDKFSYQPDLFKCWCKAKGESSYINIINDQLLVSLFKSYWIDCNEFEMIFRETPCQSPNSSSPFASLAPTSPESPASTNPDLHSLLDSKLSLRENQVCPFSQEEVEKILPDDRLTISNDMHLIIVDSNYISEFIESQLNQGWIKLKSYIFYSKF